MDEEEWDVKTATKKLMEHVKHAIHSDPIKKYADNWAKRGKIVRSSEELIKCYYANVRVVRVPAKGRNMLIKKQVDQLHLELSWACQASFKAKWEARQYCTTEELNRYLQAAFDHFTSKPDQPFNFVDVALKANPIPQSFAEHILALAVAASNGDEFGNAINGFDVFRRLSHIVASYILLDCIRYKRPGKRTSPAYAVLRTLYSRIHQESRRICSTSTMLYLALAPLTPITTDTFAATLQAEKGSYVSTASSITKRVISHRREKSSPLGLSRALT
jgi:hypothetical protein